MKIMNNIEMFEDEIISIEEYEEIDTIDITVEDTHMFFANDIYTHNSGFDSEYIGAQHSGGSIKRIQKAHFFMSVGKTKEQKEAQLANIMIIKARFAHDGQMFKDCTFNNDTMEIIIQDSRFPSTAMVSKNLKHHDSEDIDKMEVKANKLHVAISDYSEFASIGRANSESKEDVFSNLKEMYSSIKEGETPINIDAVEEINEMINIEPMGIDAVEEINKMLQNEVSNITEVINEIKFVENIEDVENNLVDPDELNTERKSVHQMLIDQRKNQIIIKK